MSPVLFDLAQRYPQLYLAPAPGLSLDERYRDIVRRGEPSKGGPLGEHFSGSPEDRNYTQSTPAGEVEVVFLKNRRDFEAFYRIMACRGEPEHIPETMGAATISGIINWRKIEAHRKTYEEEGGTVWPLEFSSFTADTANYQDTLILVSAGAYSAVSPGEAGFSPPEWLEKSIRIRTMHEVTHFIRRKNYPGQIHAVWDEVVADAMGLIFALGVYEPRLARRFLGVSPEGYQKGRLENYTECRGADLDALAANVSLLIDRLHDSLPLDTGQQKDEQLFSIIDRWQNESAECIRRYLNKQA